MKRLIALAVMVAAILPARADEGMWLPALISQRIADMQAKGLQLTAEDLYSVNHASLKDAIVLFGGGCTGEVVSDQGLLLTNHHCGYSYIQRHSSVEHDYLKDGFWAMNQAQELPNPGLTVRFLERMDNVTEAVLEGITDALSEEEKASLISQRCDAIRQQAEDPAQGLVAQVSALYYGNQYFLYVFRQFRDVRLVGAPPSSIGKFGGETDNWMWPRHTGDFSIFRIYAAPDGTPADYSPENVPYRPKKSFEISRAGVQEGDFTFVYGCPGSTREYIHSAEVDYVATVSDPERIALRDQRLGIMKKYMTGNQAVRIQYSSKYASVANAWKKWQGEAKGIVKMQTVARKQAYEARFAEWAQGTRYEGLTERLATLYAAWVPYQRTYEYFLETVNSVELPAFAGRLSRNLDKREAVAEAFFKDYYQPIDEEIFEAMLTAFFDEVPDTFQPAFFKEQLVQHGSVHAWREWLYANSCLTDPARVAALESLEQLQQDPAYQFYDAYIQCFSRDIYPVLSSLDDEIEGLYHDYMQGQMDFEPDKAFYPDANLTLRIAYGHVEGYRPCDAVYYQPVSTLRGIMEKDNPDIFDYNIPQVLRDLYAQGGYEDQPVCFLATNHTTGGNSGSPVLNARGQLIGINFDRVWEGTMSDIVFDPEVCRNISLDIRYLLFVVEKVGGAGYLLDEMHFTN